MDSLSPQPSLLRHRSFVLFWCARTSTSGAYQMQAVAVGWQLYDLTHDPLDLGLVGLMQFFPVVVLTLVIGQTVDHFDRRVIAGTCQVVKAICAALFALGTLQGWLDRDTILSLILITGTARAFEAPTLHAIVPGIVPRPLLPRAIAASATAQQTAIIAGRRSAAFSMCSGPRWSTGCARRSSSGEHSHQLRAGQAPRRAKKAGQRRDGVRRLRLHPQQSDPARRHLARSVRRAASAASPRCCRSMPAIFSAPDRGDSACCARRRRSARSACRCFSRATPSSAAPAICCWARSACSGSPRPSLRCRPGLCCRSRPSSFTARPTPSPW